MSRKEEYLAKAQEVAALAERCGDRSSRDVLLEAARSWRMLAELEDGWAWPVRPSSEREAS